MLVQASQGQSGSAHVVVLGNEKGGSGKSTTALHIAVALMKAGQRVATIDLDSRQQSFTRYIGNRSAWARRTGLDLEIPDAERLPNRIARVRFFPDGTSGGGSVTLRTASGQAKVVVDWITGEPRVSAVR